MEQINCSKFKPNHYYVLTHKEYAKTQPVKCIVRIIKYDTCDDIWDLQIISVIKSAYEPHMPYYNGMITSWYEEWCSEIKEITNKAQLLAVAL